jgi:hypothetical protein
MNVDILPTTNTWRTSRCRVLGDGVVTLIRDSLKRQSSLGMFTTLGDFISATLTYDANT